MIAVNGIGRIGRIAVRRLALSRPDIEFHFINNNKVSVVTPGNGNLFDTIGAIYGAKVMDSLLQSAFLRKPILSETMSLPLILMKRPFVLLAH